MPTGNTNNNIGCLNTVKYGKDVKLRLSYTCGKRRRKKENLERI